jgi:CheY-like chemotaxis protein
MQEEGKAKEKEHTLKVRVSNDQGAVRIEFQDSGPGIKEPNRIFEPFYTTKSVGKGTGLGLSICYGIVKEHGGEISARNADGGGAIIAISLPPAGQLVAAVQGASAPAQRREAALHGRILVVEDEESVLDFEREVLAGAGAQVVTAASIEKMHTEIETQAFDALILNGKMPGAASVAETCEWIKNKRPELEGHFLFTFSSLAETEVRSFLEKNKIPLLVKPFEVGDLIASVRKLLAKYQAAAAR